MCKFYRVLLVVGALIAVLTISVFAGSSDRYFFVDYGAPPDIPEGYVIGNWPTPEGDTDNLDPRFDPGFLNVMVGWRANPLIIGIKAEPGKKYVVALGFCERWFKAPGRRVLDVYIGDEFLDMIDPVHEAGHNVPLVRQYIAEDTNGDGWIKISVEASPFGDVQHCILNTVWVFEDDGSGEVDEAAVISGSLNDEAYVYLNVASEDELVLGTEDMFG